MKLKYLFATLLLTIGASAQADWYLRGTYNGWAAAQMSGGGTNTMELKNVVFDSAGSVKFDRYGDWSQNYGVGGFNGANIPVAAGKWNIKFYTDTKNWNISRVVDFHLRGTHNGWAEGDLLTSVSGSSTNYEICRNFASGTSTSSPRFKIDPNGDWGTDSFPAQDYPASGWTKITINGTTRAIVSVKNKLPVNCGAPIEISAWIGAQNASVIFPAVTNGMEFLRSSDSTCNFVNIASCANGQTTILNGSSVLDRAATIDSDATYVLKSSDKQTSLRVDNISNEAFSARYGSQVVVFQNRLWVVGGVVGLLNVNLEDKNDVWSSADGLTWKLETANAAFSARTGHQVVAYKGKLWLIGGYDLIASSHPKNDVWSSVDGVNWILENNNAAFSPRTGHQVVVHNNKLWMTGGFSGEMLVTDTLWSSTDGVNWLQATAPFSARFDHSVISFNNKLWLYGGLGADAEKNAWVSDDGLNWTEAAQNFPFRDGADEYKIVVGDHELWSVNIENSEVFSSTDGVNWIARSTAPFSFRSRSGVAYFNGKVMVVGGFLYDEPNPTNEVWVTADGSEWRKGFYAAFQFLQ